MNGKRTVDSVPEMTKGNACTAACPDSFQICSDEEEEKEKDPEDCEEEFSEDDFFHGNFNALQFPYDSSFTSNSSGTVDAVRDYLPNSVNRAADTAPDAIGSFGLGFISFGRGRFLDQMQKRR